MALQRKSYKITCSLEEGYGPNGKLHSVGDAANIIKQWLSMRIEQQQVIVTGLLQEGTLFFPSKTEGSGPVTASPTVIYTGELSSEQDLQLDDNEVKNTLEMLAKALKDGLRQESVFIVYQDLNWRV